MLPSDVAGSHLIELSDAELINLYAETQVRRLMAMDRAAANVPEWHVWFYHFPNSFGGIVAGRPLPDPNFPSRNYPHLGINVTYSIAARYQVLAESPNSTAEQTVQRYITHYQPCVLPSGYNPSEVSLRDTHLLATLTHPSVQMNQSQQAISHHPPLLAYLPVCIRSRSNPSRPGFNHNSGLPNHVPRWSNAWPGQIENGVHVIDTEAIRLINHGIIYANGVLFNLDLGWGSVGLELREGDRSADYFAFPGDDFDTEINYVEGPADPSLDSDSDSDSDVASVLLDVYIDAYVGELEEDQTTTDTNNQ